MHTSKLILVALVFSLIGSVAAPARAGETVGDTRAEDTIRQTLSHLRVLQSVSYKGLTIVPLVFGKKHLSVGEALARIQTLDEALEAGTLLIRETGRGEVAKLLVENRGNAPVLLMAGEILTGGKQNRTLRQDVLLPPRSGEFVLPAYCVEEGRWRDKTTKFGTEGSLAHPGLRKKALEAAPQSRVWEEVRERSAEAKVSSPTKDIQAFYSDRKVVAQTEQGLAVIEKHPWDAGTAGIIVIRDGRIIGMDLFGHPALFAKLRRKVIRTYLLDEILPLKEKVSTVKGRELAEQFLLALEEKTWAPVPSVGIGRLFRMEGKGAGSALTYRGSVAHLAALP